MSHSQFHSTNLFILRHAWLNLWDKHMTTGRINQVTTFHSLMSQRTQKQAPATRGWNNLFHRQEFVINSWRFKCSLEMHSVIVLANQSRQMKHLVPRSHKFQTHFSLSQKSNRDHGLQRELHTTGRASIGFPAQSWRILKWLIATGLAISK